MKRIVTVMIVMALFGGAAFARGNTEYDNSSRQGMGAQSVPAAVEEVSVSGTVEEIDGQVVLNTAEGIYSLSAPGFYRAGVEIPFGETIEVRGSETETLADCDIEADGHIFVETAMVNGEELSFSNGRNSARGQQSMGQGSRDGSGPINASQGNSGRGNSGRGNSSQGNSGRGGNSGRNSNHSQNHSGRGNSGQGSRWNNN